MTRRSPVPRSTPPARPTCGSTPMWRRWRSRRSTPPGRAAAKRRRHAPRSRPSRAGSSARSRRGTAAWFRCDSVADYSVHADEVDADKVDPVKPGPRPGMVGGGQLARMTHQAAISLGLSLRVLAENPDDAAALVAHDVDLGAPDDLAALRAFAKGCDVVTFDHEHVPGDHIRALQRDGVVVYPGADALAHAQDKLVMRRRLEALGVPVPAYAAVREPSDLTRFADDHGWPVVLKAVRGGYDGRGVWMLTEVPDELPGAELYVEQRVPLVH